MTFPVEKKVPYKILCLDGGGAKGFYSLGVLHEIEAMAGQKLHELFDLVFGTSTGAIIAALIAQGSSIDDIHGLYKDHVVKVMKRKTAAEKSKVLAELTDDVFGDAMFGDVKTPVGIVTTKWMSERPMIFKGSVAQAHGRTGSFIPGFGVRISDALQASCSAFPFFNRKFVHTMGGDDVARYLKSVQLLQKTLEINTQSMDQLRTILFKDVPTIRISDTFEKPDMATDLFEHNLKKLNVLRQRGRDSFASREIELNKLLLK